jgi:two-component system response regulator HydG
MGGKRGNGAADGIRIIHFRPSRTGGVQPDAEWLDGLVSDLITCESREHVKEALRQHATCALIVSYGCAADAIDVRELETFHEIRPGLRIIALLDACLATAPSLSEVVKRKLVFHVHLAPQDRDGLRFDLAQIRTLHKLETAYSPPNHGNGRANGYAGDLIVGNDPQFRRSLSELMKAARASAPVLITGESGTGKELAARLVHDASEFRAGPLVAVNCAGLSPTLVASELFGHEKGAFTDAKEQKIGKIEAAQNGTLFLDEIADLPLELQGYLLRFLEDHSVVRVGGTRALKINARVVAATNVDLRKRIAEGRFRQDLFYRLNILTAELPPLRLRMNDAFLLAQHFLEQFKSKLGRPGLSFSKCARDAIIRYDWPGNVRELLAVIQRAVVMGDTDVIDANALHLPGEAAAPPPIDLETARAAAEREVIRAALHRANRNVFRASKQLGVSRVTLYRLMEKHALVPVGSLPSPGGKNGHTESA